MIRKIVITFCTFLFVLSNVMAQEQDPWVGTWTSESYKDVDFENSPKDSEGTYQSLIHTDYKLIIRITKNGNQYHVRAKTIKLNNPNNTYYHDAYKVTSVSQNTLWLEQFFSIEPSYDDNYEYTEGTRYTKLSLNNGVLHFSHYKVHIVTYDKYKRLKEEYTYNGAGAGRELDLFNDDW